MYVLILTLMWPYQGGAASIDHITGFATTDGCLAAGNAWIKHMDTSYAKAICVKAS